MIRNDSKIMLAQRTLARGRMTRLCCQSLIAGPAKGRLITQAWKRGEHLEKRNAERIRNGVVGRIGRKIPITPKTKLIQAKKKKIIFTEGFYPDHEGVFLASKELLMR